MSCNCNNQPTNYNICNPPPCQEPQDCSCPTILSTDCVTYEGNDLECSGIVTGQTLTETIEQLDTFICEKVDDITNALTLKNIGAGAKVYKGDDLLGRKELRTITKTGDLVTVTENTNDIAVSINEVALNTFIEVNQKTYSVDNVGTGATIYKNNTVVGDNTQFNFKSVLIDSQSGMGESFVRDIQQNTDDITVRVKKIKSDTLTITSTDEEISLDLAESAQIPALYVNNLYIPTYNEWVNGGGDLVTNASFLYRGEGTLAKPFTDSINYTSTVDYTITANTSIQNALDGHPTLSYVGTGTRLAPQRNGEQIIIQNNNGSYIFSGDFSYNNIYLKVQSFIDCTTSGWLIDMDNPLYFSVNNSQFNIEIEEGKIVSFNDSLGFRNSGNTDNTPPTFQTQRVGNFLGEGTLYTAYNGVDVLSRYIFNGEGNNNDSSLHFNVKCKVNAIYQGIYKTKNSMRIDFYNQLQSGIFLGSVDIALKAFHMEGGQVRFFEKGAVVITSEISGRTYGMTFEPIGDGIGNTNFQLNSAKVSGNCNYAFAKLNNEAVSFLAFNSPSGGEFSTTLPGSPIIVPGLFENIGATPWSIDFKNNVFSFTGIDFTKVDLTQGNNSSSINFIGNNVVEVLVTRDDRASALLSGLPIYSAYLKTGGVAYPTTAGWVRDIVLPA